MNEILSIAYGYLRAAWRRRNVALKTTWIAAALIWMVVLLLPDKYEASAKVFVDARTALRPVLEGIAIQEDYESALSLVREALLSRPQLEAVARKTNLDADVDSPAAMDALVTVLKEQIVVGSVSTETASGAPSSDTVYTISYQNGDRAMSEEVVRTLLNNFIEGTSSGNRSGSDEAQTFLNKQIADLEKRLQQAEGKLAEFKKRNIGLIPGERGDYFSRLTNEMTGLQTAETNLAVATSRRSELQRQLASARVYLPGSAGSTPNSVGASAPAPDISIRRQEAEARLEELLLRFTDKHPEVLALQQTIVELRERETKELADLQRGGMGTGAIRSLSVNPVYQQIQGQLNQTQVEIASFQGAITQHRREIANLRQYVDQAPEIEQEFARLNRDYGVTKEQYDQLVARREQARVSDDAARTGIVRFDVIEPPRASIEPVSPKRALLIIAGLLGAIGLGLALAVLPFLIKPTFDDADSVERKLGLPVLGTVSAMREVGERASELASGRKVVFAMLALVTIAGLLVVFGGAGSNLLRGLIS